MMRFRDLLRSRLSTSDHVKNLKEVDNRKVDVAEGGIGDLAKDTGKLLLNVLVEVSDALPPLKSAVAGLQIVIEHVEKTGDNKIKMEKLLERVTKIRDISTTSLTTNMEPTYRQDLQSKLDQIRTKLAPINEQGKAKRLVKASSHAALMEEYIGEVEEALAKYQLSLVMDIHRMGLEHLNHDERALLDKLPRAKDALYKGSHDLPSCLEGTRVDVLGALHAWAIDSTALQIYWLNGHAGSGKSTIARSLASSLSLNGHLGASFFCSRDSRERSDLKKIFPTIAFQLATALDEQSAKYRTALLSVLRSHPDIASSSLRNQLDELIVKPALESDLQTIIIIDALDECRDEGTTSLILSLLSSTISRLPNIKLFITSRPEPHIRLGFRLREMQPITQVMILHEIAATSVNKDIRLFLEKELTKIAAQRSDVVVHQAWPKQHELDALTEQAAGLFIFAATVVKFIGGGGGNPRQQLDRILHKADRSAHDDVYPSNSFHADVDALYSGILKDAFAVIGNDRLLKHRLRAILGLLIVAHNPLNPATIAEILGIEGSDIVKSSLRWLHSVIFVPEDHSSPLRFHHKSFPDFLTDATRCQSPDFYINLDNCHFDVAECCLNVLRDRLQKNICGRSRYDLNDDLDSETRDRCIAESTKYSSRYWADHLLAARTRNEHLHRIASSLKHFLTEQQLLWFEVLALMRDLGLAVSALENVKFWLDTGKTEPYTALLDWVNDGRRFVLWAFDAIDASAAHIYHSALPFAPETSLIKQHHTNDLVFEANVIGGRTIWDGTVRAIQPDGRYKVHALEYSHTGTLLALGVGSDHQGGFSRLYRARTGELVASLDSTPVHSVSFSPDDKMLATATDDTIRLWDIGTGDVLTQLICRSGTHVAFHPSLHYHLLLTEEKYVALWNDSLGTFIQRFQPPNFRGKACWVSRQAMVLLAMEEMEMWELDPPRQVRSFVRPPHSNVHGNDISSVACSDDGVWVASGTQEGDVRIYRAGTGDLAYHLSNYDGAVKYDKFGISYLRFLPILVYGRLLLLYKSVGGGLRVYFPERIDDNNLSVTDRIADSSVFSSDGYHFAVGVNGVVSIRDLNEDLKFNPGTQSTDNKENRGVRKK